MNSIASIIRPCCFGNLQGLAAYKEDQFLILDGDKGYIATVDSSNNTTIINSGQTDYFRYASGLDYYHHQIWYTKNKRVLRIQDDFSSEPEVFAVLNPRVSGVVVTKTEVYVVTTTNRIYVFENTQSAGTPQPIREYDSPGADVDDITFHDGHLWVCDSAEQTIYCLDPNTGKVKYNFLVPFESPKGIAFSKDQLYVGYSNEEAVIKDDGAGETLDLVMKKKSRNFIHRLLFQHNENKHYTMSRGYLIEASYMEEIDPIRDAQDIDEPFEWWMSLPNATERQEVVEIHSIGKDFTIQQEDDQKYAVFKFKRLNLRDRHVFGWKALLKVHAIKYNLTPADVDEHLELPDDMKDRYLKDDDNLAMHTPIVKKAAREATKGATNILDRVLKIRNYVYEQLTYRMEGGTDSPDVVLKRGNGSCGEYLGVLMALMRLNGIACRKAGRYKVPYYKVNPESRNVPIEPDFNHVWVEFYVPGWGWIPMESSADDNETGKWTMRYFMGLQWYHIQMQQGSPFEYVTGTDNSVGVLGINYIRFRILEELN
ncbi:MULTISPECIES: transglutaminase domain-containing protein [Nostoc]|uniref:Transglutaminase n=1 Tax=Nostoc paludosum FACHB-159 TaxID=2692908 RepID=A0ABR8KI61_9NOSO|nr:MULTISPECIES: transglutaminase domain-containing protein [Nostoc]MBD2682914.1 transglutaminase [Nostoc sp. FACHB-857]MBD2739251.1 transglutaminase [Nostoc paludosum FACHB-159]